MAGRAWTRERFIRRFGEEDGAAKWEKSQQRRARQIDTPAGNTGPTLKERAPRREPKGTVTKKKLAGTLQTGIWLSDLAVAKVFYPPWEEDRLNPQEIALLSDALADEILPHKRLTEWITRFEAATGPHAKLVYIALVIAVPRMVKHGMIPAGAVPESWRPANAQTAGDTVPMEPGTTPGPDRYDGQWEVDAGQFAPGQADVLSGAEEQGGRDQVPGGGNGEVILGAGRFPA